MEFLMTYGWAILVVLIVIGVMMYSGFVDVSGLLPEKCTFPISVTCLDSSVKKDSIQLHLQNAAGKVMVVRNIKVTSEALAGPSDSDHGVCELNPSQRDHLMKKSSKQVFSVNVRSSTTLSTSGPQGSFNDLNLLADGIMLVRAQLPNLDTALKRLNNANRTLNSVRADYLEADDAYEDVIRAIDEINETARDFANPRPVANEAVVEKISRHVDAGFFKHPARYQAVDFFKGNASEARDLREISQKINDTGEHIIDVSNTSAWLVFNVAEGIAVDASNKYADANNTVAKRAKDKANSFDDADERHFALLVAGNATGETALEVVNNANRSARSGSLRNAAVARAQASSSSDSQTEVLRAALDIFVSIRTNVNSYRSRLVYDHETIIRDALTETVRLYDGQLGHKAAEFVQNVAEDGRSNNYKRLVASRRGADVIKTAVDHLIDEGNGVDAAVAAGEAADPDHTYDTIRPDSLHDVVSHYNTALAGNSPATVKNAVHAAADDVADTANRLSPQELYFVLKERLDREPINLKNRLHKSSFTEPAAYALFYDVMECLSELSDLESGGQIQIENSQNTQCTFEDFDDNTKFDEAFRFIESRTNELIVEYSGGRNEELVDAYLSAANETALAAHNAKNKAEADYSRVPFNIYFESSKAVNKWAFGTLEHAAGNAVRGVIPSVGGTVNGIIDDARTARMEYVDDVTEAVNDITSFAAGEVAKHEDDASETVSSVSKNEVINKINLHKDALDKFSGYSGHDIPSTKLIEIVNENSGNPEAMRQLFYEEFSKIERFAKTYRTRSSYAFNTASTEFDGAKQHYCALCNLAGACDPAAACGVTSLKSDLGDVADAVEDVVEGGDGDDDEGGEEGGDEGGTEEDAANEPSETFSDLTIPSGDTKQLDVTNQDIPFQSVNFTVSNSVSNLDLTITTRSDLPSGIESPGVVPSSNGYINITSMPPSSFDNDDVSSMNVTFRVKKGFVFDNRVSPGDVSLFRYDEDAGEWIELDTVHLPGLDILKADNYHYYEAKGTDDLLGVFAIALGKFISCVHREGVKGKNRYGIELVYSWQNSPSITHRITGELLANAP